MLCSISRSLGSRLGREIELEDAGGISGGCISEARRVEERGGEGVWFLKTQAAAGGEDVFTTEAAGLKALAEVGAIRVARPVDWGRADGRAFLLLEHIETRRPSGGFWEAFGRQFACLHVESRSDRFGFDVDNYIGSTPQPNPWCDDWVEFFREHRLGHQLRLARESGRASPSMNELGERLLGRLGELIGEPDEPACLLHGDLWGGNHLCDAGGDPVLIDPAVYHGRREADLAMTDLFGGFDPRFYAAYEEVWPLETGSRERQDLYKLYHLLNHLNLFGSGYHDSSMAIIQRYA